MQVINSKPDKLPRPDPASKRHSERVAEHLREVIRNAGGSIGFARFMHESLYAPGLGYYSAGSSKFGESGDFITAPMVSPLFARVVGSRVAQVFDGMDSVDERNLLEFGAGNGALAIELLRKLDELGATPQRYFILEVAADLQERQAAAISAALPALSDRVQWLTELPAGFSGVVIANEVLDALPVERFCKSDDELCQQKVAVSGDRFVWSAEPAAASLRQAVQAVEKNIGRSLPDGYVSEVPLAAADWMAKVAQSLRRGCALIFDYGISEREYYAVDRSDGWLRCHFRHHAHSDPLILPGIQDLSAWVNFSAVAQAAFDNGLEISAWVTQSQFLLAAGLQTELADIAGLPTRAQIDLSRQVKVLTMPGEMGENIKCLVLQKGQFAMPDLFAAADRAHTL